MNFFGKMKKNKISKTLAAVVASGVLFFGAGNAIAAPDDDANFEFRQAYLSIPQDNRAFHQSIVFFGTTFHADINSNGVILRDASMRMNGNFNWEYTNPKTNVTTNTTMPFYLTQSGDEMTFYIQRNNKWSKFSLPGVPVALANALKANDLATLQDNIHAVKNVSIFRENRMQQIFNITLDGKYIANLMQGYSRKQDTTELSASEVVSQQNFFRNLSAALQKTDINCMWTVDKTANRTVTAVFDFTDLMRTYAKNILDESAEGTIVLSEEEMLLMDTIGYYSEFHYSFSYSGADSKYNFNLPNAAQKAAVNNNIFSDLFKDMTTKRR